MVGEPRARARGQPSLACPAVRRLAEDVEHRKRCRGGDRTVARGRGGPDASLARVPVLAPLVHHVGAAAKRGDGIAAAHRLAVGDEGGADAAASAALPWTTGTRPEPPPVPFYAATAVSYCSAVDLSLHFA